MTPAEFRRLLPFYMRGYRALELLDRYIKESNLLTDKKAQLAQALAALDELPLATLPEPERMRRLERALRSVLTVMRELVNEPAVASEMPKLPAFEELQEGDWVRIRWCNTEFNGCIDAQRQLQCGTAGPFALGVDDHGADVLAFKPLRQVVEELARTILGSEARLSLIDVSPSEEFVRSRLDVCGKMSAHFEHGELAIWSNNERTALLAAKAALEVMIARKAK